MLNDDEVTPFSMHDAGRSKRIRREAAELLHAPCIKRTRLT